MIAARDGTGWRPYASSFLLHGVLLVLITAGWLQIRHPSPPLPRLAIEATVVTAPPASAPAPEPVRPEPAPAQEAPPPQPDATALQRQAEEKLAEKARAAEARQAEQRRVEAEAAEAERQKKLEAERKADADRKAEAAKQAQLARQKAEDEKKRKQAELQKQAEQEASAREQADLRARMAAEERVNAARSGAQAQQYAALIRARVEHNWIRPPTARAGLDCEVRVTQVPGGAVTAVKLGQCNGDAAVRESIEAAVYRASPLPTPENPDLFERNLVFNFRPNE